MCVCVFFPWAGETQGCELAGSLFLFLYLSLAHMLKANQYILGLYAPYSANKAAADPTFSEGHVQPRGR